MTTPHFLVSFDDTELDHTCGMRYWLSRYESGSGLAPKATLLDEAFRTQIHADLRNLALMPDISPTAMQAAVDEMIAPLSAADRQDQKRMESLYRRLGWLVAFALYVEPGLRETYETIPLGAEIILDRDPLWVSVRPDRLLREKTTGMIHYREYVPMRASLSNKQWLEGWAYAMRLHVGITAVNEWLEDYPLIQRGQVMGLAEGYRSLLNGRQVHPYTWGYRHRQTEEWAHTFKPTSDDQWKLEPVWNFPGGIVAWVQLCGDSVAQQQFPLSPLVQANAPMLTHWVANRLNREREIATFRMGSQLNFSLRQVHFPQRTSQCYPAHGDACPFLGACWSSSASVLPLLSGLFIPNVVYQEVKEAEVVVA